MATNYIDSTTDKVLFVNIILVMFIDTCCQGLREGSSADISVRGPESQEGACEYLKSLLILTKEVLF
jgi:hypothetical protein